MLHSVTLIWYLTQQFLPRFFKNWKSFPNFGRWYRCSDFHRTLKTRLPRSWRSLPRLNYRSAWTCPWRIRPHPGSSSSKTVRRWRQRAFRTHDGSPGKMRQNVILLIKTCNSVNSQPDCCGTQCTAKWEIPFPSKNIMLRRGRLRITWQPYTMVSRYPNRGLLLV